MALFTRVAAPSQQASTARGTSRRASCPHVRDSRALGNHPNGVIHEPACPRAMRRSRREPTAHSSLRPFKATRRVHPLGARSGRESPRHGRSVRHGCSALAKRKPTGGERRQLTVVRGERLTPELGDARLRARKEERAAGTGDDRRRARVAWKGSRGRRCCFCRFYVIHEGAGDCQGASGRFAVRLRCRCGLSAHREVAAGVSGLCPDFGAVLPGEAWRVKRPRGGARAVVAGGGA
jgi:hypothetical protein